MSTGNGGRNELPPVDGGHVWMYTGDGGCIMQLSIGDGGCIEMPTGDSGCIMYLSTVDGGCGLMPTVDWISGQSMCT